MPQSFDPDESFGRRLRHERERRHIDLTLIAQTSKISASLFRDLERDDPSRWPSGIFRRAFIRAYAEAIGLDPNETMWEFLERFPDRNEVQPATGGVRSSSLRLTLADTNTVFLRGRLLRPVHSRLAAAAFDALVVTMLGLALYAALGVWWMPLSVVVVGYYLGSILLLGNTPGVCLCAPGRAPTSHDHESLWQRIRSSADSLPMAVVGLGLSRAPEPDARHQGRSAVSSLG